MSDYHKLSLQQKQAAALSSMREPARTCPWCDTQLTRSDLLRHMETRCPGRREPGPGAKWLVWRDAIALVPKRTLIRWTHRGHVRTKGGRGDRLYLHGDIVDRLAARMVARRR